MRLNSFILKRIHSLTGLLLLLFLFEHILTNSQATLFIGDDGKGFLDGVNLIHLMPYLPMIEIFFIAVPMAIHMILGVIYLLKTKYNSFPTDGSAPYLKYGNNHAFTWQRLTAWILLVGVILHVSQMRFLEQPIKFKDGSEEKYITRLTLDDGLYTLSKRFDVKLYDKEKIEILAKNAELVSFEEDLILEKTTTFDSKKEELLQRRQKYQIEKEFASALQKRPLSKNQVMAVSPSFSKAILLVVRDVLKSPIMIMLYAMLVLATAFHAINGLRTFLITWGVTLSERSQQMTWKIVIVMMLGMVFLGLAATGVYWLNLYR